MFSRSRADIELLFRLGLRLRDIGGALRRVWAAPVNRVPLRRRHRRSRCRLRARDTLRRLKQSLKNSDKVFLLIGVDAFADIAKWHQPEALFRDCEFIVASRPGFSLADVANALPESLRPRKEVTHPFRRQAATGDVVLMGATIHLLDQVHQPISATAIREAVTANKPLGRLVNESVADYIKKMELYVGR